MVASRTVTESVLERLVALVRRELHADDVRVLEATAQPPEAENALVVRLADGRMLVASFAAVPEDRDALSRRLDMLAVTFAQALDEAPGGRSRGAVPTSLHDELRALATRAQAVDAVVVDAHSPVVWGAAASRALLPNALESALSDISRRQLIDSDEGEDPSVEPAQDDAGDGSSEELPPPSLTPRILRAVRALPDLSTVQKGRHLRHAVVREGGGYLVMSFSGIYLLVLVYAGPFDELRAERAATEALPRIERLVMALPPLEPEPEPAGGVLPFRRRR